MYRYRYPRAARNRRFLQVLEGVKLAGRWVPVCFRSLTLCCPRQASTPPLRGCHPPDPLLLPGSRAPQDLPPKGLPPPTGLS
jgi:hypothetical protein